MSRNFFARKRVAKFESLERRSMLAGNVTAEVVGGALFIEGDNSSNAVQVRQIGEASWEVRGLGTRVNGSNSAFIANDVLLGIEADLNRGDDFIKVFNGTLDGDLLIETNQGADSIQLINLTVNGISTITTGDGADAVLISDVQSNGVGEFEGAALNLNTHGSSDVVVVDRLLAASANIHLGGGNDSLAMTRSEFNIDLRIRGSDGTDAISLNDVDADTELWVHMGDGDFDALAVANSSAITASFRGGNGEGDTLSTANNNFDVELINDFEFTV